MLNYLIVLALIIPFKAFSIDLTKLQSNKERGSNYITYGENDKLRKWISNHHFSIEKIRSLSQEILLNSTKDKNKGCDLEFNEVITDQIIKSELVNNKDEIVVFFNFLRSQNYIDDIFLNLLKKNYKISKKIEAHLNDNLPLIAPPFIYIKDHENIKTEELFSYFAKKNNRKSKCIFNEYKNLAEDLGYINSRHLNYQLIKLNYRALIEDVIDLQTYNTLEVLRKSKVATEALYLENYFEKLENVKDLNIKDIKTDTASIPKHKISIFRKLTNREKIYNKFNSAQMVLLSDILDQTSKRINAKSSKLDFEFENDVHDTYVLSPIEQYRASLRLLRKEISTAERSELFKGSKIEYTDIVAAAFETGVISASQIEYVLKFEDLWNPKTPAWKSYVNLVFGITGTASLYLPPPWNVIGALALVITQAKVNELIDKNNNSRNDNPNSIF